MKAKGDKEDSGSLKGGHVGPKELRMGIVAFLCPLIEAVFLKMLAPAELHREIWRVANLLVV